MSDGEKYRQHPRHHAVLGYAMLAAYLITLVVLMSREASIVSASRWERVPSPLLFGVLGFDGMVSYLYEHGVAFRRFGGDAYLWVSGVYAFMLVITQSLCAWMTRRATDRGTRRRPWRITRWICEGYVWSLGAMATLTMLMGVADQWKAFTGDHGSQLSALGVVQPMPRYGAIITLMLVWGGLWALAAALLHLLGRRDGRGEMRLVVLAVAAVALVMFSCFDALKIDRFESHYTVRVFAATALFWLGGYAAIRLLFRRVFLAGIPPRYCTGCGANNPPGLRYVGSPCVACGRRRWPVVPWTIRFQGFAMAVGLFVVWEVGSGLLTGRLPSQAWAALPLVLIFVLVWGLLTIMLAERRYDKRVVPKLGRYCLKCNYDLRGTTSAGRTECPECGTPIPHVDDHRVRP